MALVNAVHHQFTATGNKVVMNNACHFYGIILGTDGVNDPTITVYDNPSTNSGDIVSPPTTFDASALGFNGFVLAKGVRCWQGLTVRCVLGGGTCDVVVLMG